MNSSWMHHYLIKLSDFDLKPEETVNPTEVDFSYLKLQYTMLDNVSLSRGSRAHQPTPPSFKF